MVGRFYLRPKWPATAVIAGDMITPVRTAPIPYLNDRGRPAGATPLFPSSGPACAPIGPVRASTPANASPRRRISVSQRQKGLPRPRHNGSSASFHPPHNALGFDIRCAAHPPRCRYVLRWSNLICEKCDRVRIRIEAVAISKFSVSRVEPGVAHPRPIVCPQANQRSGEIIVPVPVRRWSLAVPNANFGQGAPSRPTALRFPRRCAAFRSRRSSSMRAR
jgi:hypothetical protein